MSIETEAFEVYEKEFKNETKIEQVHYDCFGNPVHLMPGDSKLIKQRRRIKPKDLAAALEKEATSGTDEGDPQRSSEKDSREPEENPTGRASRRFHRKGT